MSRDEREGPGSKELRGPLSRSLAVLAALGEGRRVEAEGGSRRLLIWACALVAGYLAWLALYGAVHEHFHAAAFAAVVFPLGFLTTTRGPRAPRVGPTDWAWALLSSGVFLWYALHNQRYQDWMRGLDELADADRLAGMLVVLVVLEFSRRCVGWGLTGVTLVVLAYVAWGGRLGGGAGHDVESLDYFLDLQTMGVDGIFGIPLGVAASYAFLFVWFGALYQRSSGGQLFFDAALKLTGRARGAAAKACVVSSGLYGSISGSPTADVATTGPINIPIMLRSGIPAERAAAIEASASAGGALLPPVMGAVAFLMADYTGIPYRDIAAAALLPALLYYAALLFGIHRHAATAEGEGGLEESGSGPDESPRRYVWRQLCRGIPILVLLTLLGSGYSPSYVAAGAALAVPVALLLTPAPRPAFGTLLEGSYEALYRVVPLTAAVASAGLIIGCIELTGLSGKFATLLLGLSGGAFLPTVFLAAGVLLLLGMGMPTPGVYVMGAALIAPVLVGDFGMGLLPAHLFILYVACISAVTPPIAVACFAAASVASVRAMAVAPRAFRLALPGLVLALFLVLNPGVVEGPFQGFVDAPVPHGLALIAWACAGLLSAVAFAERVSLPVFGISLGILGALVFPNPITQAAGIVATSWLVRRGGS